MKIAVAGCSGRMGREVLKAVLASEEAALVAGSLRPGSPEAGQDLGWLAGVRPIGILATENIQQLFEKSDAIIDFTIPSQSVALARMAAEAGKVLICGTTGLNTEQKQLLREASTHTAIVHSHNMSLGVNLLLSLVEKTARALDDSFDIEITEMHHRLKVDAPSGTALTLGEAAAKGREVRLKDVEQRSREGQTGPRSEGAIGFSVLRGGDVIGDHTVIFAGPGERIELTHKASNRTIYAYGALKAALWAAQQKPGLYSMQDVLGLK
jgi:4-hydroxy-tetrahydrodipicolinate reductase